ncbi:phospho-sugar mutase [soil metagenome]
MISPALRERVNLWIDRDPSEATQNELRTLLEAGTDAAARELEDRFAGVLEFGTAGLRGVLGGGPNRMNRAVVLTTTHGLAAQLASAVPNARERGVVIGYDGRRLSRELAEDTAGVLTAQGFVVHLFTTVVPTPTTAYAVSALGAAAGVMVTASHNPPEYNGYKVYWGNGAQIIPPIDHDIASAIAKAPPAKDVPRDDLAKGREKGLLHDVEPKIERAYLDAIAALRPNKAAAKRDLVIVYTPMHGVGNRLARQALSEAGFTHVTSVPEQAEPDGAFPTVAFPNPEEKGAMDLAFALARKQSADLVLANDPDADRLAVAVPDAASPTQYRQLTGNEVGVLLGHYLLTREESKNRLTIASIVSSPMLGVIARALGVRYEETLTGFKWIANRAMDLKPEGFRFVFGYEEALGYTVGEVVRDKDGISAALVFSELVAELLADGGTVQEELEAIARRFGLFVSSQVNVTKKGAAGAQEIAALMDRLRAAKFAEIGPMKVAATSDFVSRKRRDAAGKETDLALPQTNMVSFDLEGGSRIIARPSGTEPKVKFYFDVREEVRSGELFAGAEALARATMKALSDAFVVLAGV